MTDIWQRSGEAWWVNLPCWKVRVTLSNMASMMALPTPDDAAAALAGAETSRAQLAGWLVVISALALAALALLVLVGR